MKKALLFLIVAALGLCVGGGAAFATVRLLGGRPLIVMEQPRAFLPTGPITAPIVSADGRLSGYVQFEAQLEVPGDQVDAMRNRLPLLLDATTMRTFKAPMASGPDGLLPDIAIFRGVLEQAAWQVYGRDRVTKVVVTQAAPI